MPVEVDHLAERSRTSGLVLGGRARALRGQGAIQQVRPVGVRVPSVFQSRLPVREAFANGSSSGQVGVIVAARQDAAVRSGVPREAGSAPTLRLRPP